MKFEVLLSCMNQNDFSVCKQSNINCHALVINQCNEEKTTCEEKVRMIYTKERGLSKSRNMALDNANGDICLIADDDELFFDDLEDKIISAFNTTEGDIVIFDLQNYHKRIRRTVHRMHKLELLKVSSVQIAFKKEKIVGKIRFDEEIGAGTKNSGGEDTAFLLDAYKNNLKIFYVPIDIGTLDLKGESSWFHGYDKKYFFDRGKVTRHTMGFVFASIYGFYFLVAKHKLYSKNINILKAFRFMTKGLFTKDINVQL